MGIPTELTLDTHDGKYYLCANPVRELDSLIYETSARECYRLIS